MSWRSILTTIGGIVAAPFTGGASIPIATAAGAAWEAQHANSEAKKAIQGATDKQVGVYQPYNQLGLQAGNSLANLLGLAGVPGAGLPASATNIAVPRTQSRIPQAQPMPVAPTDIAIAGDDGTLQSILNRGGRGRMPIPNGGAVPLGGRAVSSY